MASFNPLKRTISQFELNEDRDFSIVKLRDCYFLLNLCLNKIFAIYDKDPQSITSKDFQQCCTPDEESLLGSAIQKAFDTFTENEVSTNVVYWGILYYYYTTIVLEYNASTLCNAKEMYNFMQRIRSLLPGKPNITTEERMILNKIEKNKFTQQEINPINKFMLRIASSDDEWAQFIRGKLRAATPHGGKMRNKKRIRNKSKKNKRNKNKIIKRTRKYKHRKYK